jgi:hypothetical protein
MSNMEVNVLRFIWPRLLLVFIVVLIMILAASLPMAVAAKPQRPPVSSSFTITTVDSTRSNVGDHSRIALDADGNSHIIYYDSTNRALKYATNAGGQWSLSTIGYVSPVYGVGDIAIDSSGTVHVIYINVDQELVYLSKTSSGTWSNAVPLNLGSGIGGQISLVIDSHGSFHLCYWYSDQAGAAIVYAHGTPPNLVTEEVANCTNTGPTLSWITPLAINSSSVAHVCYVLFSGDDYRSVIYANSDEDWEPHVVGQGDIHPQIAIGSDDSVHIAYFTYPQKALRYVHIVDGVWSFQAIDSTTDTSMHYLSMDVDVNGKVHICYNDYAGKICMLMYATNAGGEWVNKVVDETGTVYWANDIEVGPDIKVYISYLNKSKMDLMYAVSI